MGRIDFRANMRRYPDMELVRIACLGEAEDLLPEAISAAREELSERGISEDQANALLNDMTVTNAAEAPRDHLEMSIVARILFVPFAFFLLLPAMICAGLLGFSGYRKKAEQAWLSIAAAVGMLAMLVITLIFT